MLQYVVQIRCLWSRLELVVPPNLASYYDSPTAYSTPQMLHQYSLPFSGINVGDYLRLIYFFLQLLRLVF
jgi:hypothetical protein